MTAVAWSIGGGALVVVGLAVTVAVLGVQLGKARAEIAAASAVLLGADAKIGRLTEERDRLITEAKAAAARSSKLETDLRADLMARDKLLAEKLPPDELRKRIQDLLAGKA